MQRSASHPAAPKATPLQLAPLLAFLNADKVGIKIQKTINSDAAFRYKTAEEYMEAIDSAEGRAKDGGEITKAEFRALRNELLDERDRLRDYHSRLRNHPRELMLLEYRQLTLNIAVLKSKLAFVQFKLEQKKRALPLPLRRKALPSPITAGSRRCTHVRPQSDHNKNSTTPANSHNNLDTTKFTSRNGKSKRMPMR